MKTAPRALLFTLGLLLVAAAQAVLNAVRWLGLPGDPFRFLARWERVLPVFADPRFGRHFAPAFVLLLAGLTVIALSLRRLPGATPSDTVLEMEVRPVDLTGMPRRWLFITLALLAVAAAAVGWFAWSLRKGPPPGGFAMLASLAAIAAALHAADLSRGRSLLSPKELLYCAAFVGFLVLLGYGYRQPQTALLTLAAGLALAVALLLTRALPREWIVLGVIVHIAFAVYASDLTSWRYAFIGDEYAYFGFARNLARARWDELPKLFAMRGGVYDQHPVFAAYVQALTIRLYGADLYGWRISESLCILLTALPVYALVRAFARPRTAHVAVLVLLSSQHLLGVSRAGYSLSQGLVPWTAAVALLLLAARRGSLAGLFLSGVAACWAFYTCAVALPLIGVPGLLFLFLFFRGRLRSVVPATLAFSAGLVITALGGLLETYWLRKMVEQTAVQGSPGPSRITGNFLTMLTAVLYFPKSSHYVSGPHLDPVSSSLMGVGLLTAFGIALAPGVTGRRVVLPLLVAFPVVCFVIGGLVPYPTPSIPRTYVLVPFYAVFAALGAERLLAAAGALGLSRRLVPLAAVPLLALIPLANLYTFRVIAQRRVRRTFYAMVFRQLERMPWQTRFVIASREDANVRLVLEAAGYAEAKLRFVPESAPRHTLRALHRGHVPVAVLLPRELPEAAREAWIAAYAELYPTLRPLPVTDEYGTEHMVQLELPPGGRGGA